MDVWRSWRMYKSVVLVLIFLGCSSDSGSSDLRENVPSPSVTEIGDQDLSPVSTCDWQDAPPSSISRLESQTALIGERLYTFSGFTEGITITAETEIFDLVTKEWSLGAPMPVAVTHMGAALVGDKVWIVGGFVGDHPGTAINVVQIYDPVSDAWSNGPDLPSPRASGALVYHQGLLHYFGGLQPDRQTDMDEHLVFDPADDAGGWQQMAPLPDGRNHLGGVSLGDHIYAVGGQFGHDGAVDDVALVHRYLPSENKWEQLNDLPEDRSHFEPGIFTFSDRIFLVGGRKDRAYADDILMYDPNEGGWTSFCELPESLLAPVSRVYNNRLYLVNGGVEGVCCPVNTMRTIELTLE